MPALKVPKPERLRQSHDPVVLSSPCLKLAVSAFKPVNNLTNQGQTLVTLVPHGGGRALGETHLLTGLPHHLNLLQTHLRDAPLAERLDVNATRWQIELGGDIGLERVSQPCVQGGILLLCQKVLRLGQTLPRLFPRL